MGSYDGLDMKVMPASLITSFKGGGEAAVLYVNSEDALICLLDKLDRAGLNYEMIGGGSDVIIADGRLGYPLLSLSHMDEVERVGECELYARAGASIAKVISEGRRFGLGGLEFLAGVPATVGGAVKMNAGAFNSSIGQFALSARVCMAYDAYEKGKAYVVQEVSCKDFSYRRGAKGIVLGATFKLTKMSKEESLLRAEGNIRVRLARQPRLPSAGSVFKNPDGQSAGRLIELCGLKGTRIGGAEVSMAHANIIVNIGGATAADYIALAALVKKRVYEAYGISLEREVKFFV